MYKNVARVRIWGSKVKGQGRQGQKKQKSAAFLGAPSCAALVAGAATPVGKSAHAV